MQGRSATLAINLSGRRHARVSRDGKVLPGGEEDTGRGKGQRARVGHREAPGEAHGGQLSIQSRESRGTTVKVMLPVATEEDGSADETEEM